MVSRVRRGLQLALLCGALSAWGCGGGDAAAASSESGWATAASIVPLRQAGDEALDFVTESRFKTLLVEVDFVTGSVPSTTALEHLEAVLAKRLSKPGGVEVQLDSEIPLQALKALVPTDKAYGQSGLRNLAASFRDYHSGEAAHRHRAAIWVVYVPGPTPHLPTERESLGAAFGASDVAVFAGALDRLVDAREREVVEAMVLLHEVGHVCGLVNNGIPMVKPHEDEAFVRHDRSPECVMYHEIETGNMWVPASLAHVDFGLRCRLDLFAVGGPHPGD